MKEKKHTIKPTGDNVIIKRLPAPKQSAGGILLPEHFRPSIPEYRVISAGPKATELKPGDVVLNKEYEGSAFEFEGEAYILVKESAIVAKKV